MNSTQRFVLAAGCFGLAIVFFFPAALLQPADVSLLQTVSQALMVASFTAGWFLLAPQDSPAPAPPKSAPFKLPPAEALDSAKTRWAGKRRQ